tara:strand:- start:123 stop:320 length:198 start_codon:yes stop_codon:yes gene_type:complete
MKKIERQTIVELSMECVDYLVKKGIIEDCTGTDSTIEWDAQDIITDVFLSFYKKTTHPNKKQERK